MLTNILLLVLVLLTALRLVYDIRNERERLRDREARAKVLLPVIDNTLPGAGKRALQHRLAVRGMLPTQGD